MHACVEGWVPLHRVSQTRVCLAPKWSYTVTDFFSPTSENLIVSAVLFSFFKVIMFYLFYVSMRGTCACHIMHVEVRGQLACECSLRHMGSGGLSLVTRLGRRCLCREPMTGIMCSGDF